MKTIKITTDGILKRYAEGYKTRDLLRPGVYIVDKKTLVLDQGQTRLENRIRRYAKVRHLCCGIEDTIEFISAMNQLRGGLPLCHKCRAGFLTARRRQQYLDRVEREALAREAELAEAEEMAAETKGQALIRLFCRAMPTQLVRPAEFAGDPTIFSSR